MPIIRIQKRENPYVQIDRAAIEDNRLSWKARGILAYLLSKPDDWHIHIFDIVNHGPDGRESITTAMRELEKFGYAKLIITRNEMGQIIQKEWAVSETPTYNGFSEVGSTEIGKPLNRQTAPISNNNKYSKNDEQRTNKQGKQIMAMKEKTVWEKIVDKFILINSCWEWTGRYIS